MFFSLLYTFIPTRRITTRRNSQKIQNVLRMVPRVLTGFITLPHPFSALQTFLYQAELFSSKRMTRTVINRLRAAAT